jgi:hypothetical protein
MKLNTPEKVLKHIIKKKGDCDDLICDGKLVFDGEEPNCVCPLWKRIENKSMCDVVHAMRLEHVKEEKENYNTYTLKMAKEKQAELEKLKYLCEKIK